MSGGDDQQLRIILDHLAQLLGLPPPPPITPDPLASGGSSISQLLRMLGLAANASDTADAAAALAGYDEREAKTADALSKFPANEEDASAQLAGVGGSSQMAQMAQQMPQLASGIAGGIAGLLGGALQPLAQIPQQLAQAGQQALQTGMGALQQGSGVAADADENSDGELPGAEGEFGGSAGGHDAGTGGGENLSTTTPTAMLSPLPAPSAGTVPSSSLTVSPTPTGSPESTPASRGAMGAMPMMPPGAVQGAGPGPGLKPDTKRIVAPTVKNGAPVNGRITTPPPAPEVVKRVDGKPVATRRILLPEQTRDDAD